LSPQSSANMVLKDCSKKLSKLITSEKLVFERSEGWTHISNVIKTDDLRCDIHRDLSYPGWAVAKIQVNKRAKEFLKKGNKGAHKAHGGIGFGLERFMN
jgi:hypothetical protein